MTGEDVVRDDGALAPRGRYVLLGGSGDGDEPLRGGHVSVTPSTCIVGDRLIVEGYFLQKTRLAGSEAVPLTAARIELVFVSDDVPSWRRDYGAPGFDLGVTDERGAFRFACLASETGTYCVALLDSEGRRTTRITSDTVTVQTLD